MDVSAMDGGRARTWWTTRGVHRAVWIAAAATLAAAVAVGQFRETETGARMENLILVRGDPEAYKEIAAHYVEASLGLDDAALSALARDQAAANTPEVLHRMSLHLVSNRDNREAGRAGVFLLVAGSGLYRSPQLLERAGWQFYLGRFVERDFEKATHYLSDPRLRYRAAAAYRLGRVLFDARNPRQDEAAGLALIRAAARRRNDLAIAWLEQTGKLVEEDGSEE